MGRRYSFTEKRDAYSPCYSTKDISERLNIPLQRLLNVLSRCDNPPVVRFRTGHNGARYDKEVIQDWLNSPGIMDRLTAELIPRKSKKSGSITTVK